MRLAEFVRRTIPLFHLNKLHQALALKWNRICCKWEYCICINQKISILSFHHLSQILVKRRATSPYANIAGSGTAFQCHLNTQSDFQQNA